MSTKTKRPLDLRKIRSGEVGQNIYDFGVIGGSAATLAGIARGTRQRHVLHRCLATSRCGNQVVEVIHAALSIEKLEDATRRHCRRAGPEAAVTADATVSLRYSGADCGWDVSGVGHACKHSSYGTRGRAAAGAAATKALKPTTVSLQASAFDLLDRMIAVTAS